MPDGAGTPTWKDHIESLFTPGDIGCMKQLGKDLGDYDYVKANAQDIYQRVSTHNMPPGNPWEAAKIELFKAWLDAGCPEGNKVFWHKTQAPIVEERYDDIWFVSPERGWAINSDGQILHTIDGGDHWDIQFEAPPNGSEPTWLRCIAFANENRGWVGTVNPSHRLYTTTDGGQNWELVENLPEDAPRFICGISVVNENVIYASGTNMPAFPTAVLKTTDGGVTWSAIPMGEHAKCLIDIRFTDEQHGIVVGGNASAEGATRADMVPVILATNDGGASWENRVTPNLAPGEWGWKIHFVNEQTGFVALDSADHAAVLRTDDGGQTWSRLAVNDPQDNREIEGVGFIDENIGWVGGYGGENFEGYSSGTIDGGKNWHSANQIGKMINRFRFIGNPITVGYAAGETIYKFDPNGFDEIVRRTGGRDRVRSIDSSKNLPGNIRWRASDKTFEIYIYERAAHAWLTIYDRFGIPIRELMNEPNPGLNVRTVVWDGRDYNGEPVSNGAYVAKLVVDKKVSSQVIKVR